MAGSVNELPKLREDLRLISAGASHAGAPTWVIHDAFANKFFKVTFEMFQLLSVWNLSPSAELLLANVEKRFGRKAEPEEVNVVLHLLSEGHLLQEDTNKTWSDLFRRANTKQVWYKRAFHSYLFFKIPLVQPQDFLKATWPIARFFFNKYFVFFCFVLGLAGLFFASRQWETFVNSFPYLFTWEGAILSILSIMLVKSLHELGHAYMAYRYGCFVPTLGIAFMAFVPMLYTDITDAWKLKSNKQRLMIDSAGIQVELLLGMICLFLWAFVPDGALRSVIFVIATASWVLSLAVNLSPLTRFDGYFILSDLLSMPNLHERTFAHMRYRIRKFLFASHEQPPEQFSALKDFSIFVFGIFVAIYRLILYIGIALLVYHFFIKLVGIVLLFGEVMFFMVQPVWRELKLWWTMRNSILKSPRSYVSGLVGITGIICLFLPISTSIEVPALLEPEKFQRLYPETAGQLVNIFVKNGDFVKQGDTLFEIKAPALLADKSFTENEITLLNLRLARIGSDAEDLGNRQVLQQQLSAAQSKVLGLNASAKKLTITAEFDGEFVDLSNRVYVGKWVSRKEQLGLIKSQSNSVSRGFIAGDDLPRVAVNNAATFVPDDLTIPSVELAIASIAQSSSKIIDLTPLTSTYGGKIAVAQNEQQEPTPLGSQYSIKTNVLIGKENSGKVLRGVLRVSAKADSIANRISRQVMRVLIKESGA